jgi:hypothetical protein
MKRLVGLAWIAGALALAGCQAPVTPIRTLLEDPGRFDRRSVAVAGTVRGSIGVLGYGAYEIDDGTGTLLIVTRESGAPRGDARVVVEGEFRSAFTVGEQTAAVLIERHRRAR